MKPSSILDYHSCCMVRIRTKYPYDEGKAKFNARQKSLHSKPSAGEVDWKNRLIDGESDGLKDVFYNAQNYYGGYGNSVFSKHKLIRNATQHFEYTENDMSLDDLGIELEKLFPNYPIEMHDFMQVEDLHSKFVKPKKGRTRTLIEELGYQLGESSKIQNYLQTFDIFIFILAMMKHESPSPAQIHENIIVPVSQNVMLLKNNFEVLRGKTTRELILVAPDNIKKSLRLLNRYIKALLTFLMELVSNKNDTKDAVTKSLAYFVCGTPLKKFISSLPSKESILKIIEYETLPDKKKDFVDTEISNVHQEMLTNHLGIQTPNTTNR